MTNNEAAKWIQLYIDLAKIDPTTGEAAYLNDDNKKTIEAMEMAINALTAQPEKRTEKRTETHACDCISRQAAIDAECEVCQIAPKKERGHNCTYYVHGCKEITCLRALPSAHPFHNITMNDVLKYIDGMPEDVWQEFTACLECRGWELKRKTAKWCGSEFA